MKRLLDLIIVMPSLMLLSPLLALVSLRIKLSSAGPVLFRQVRIGRYGHAFYIYKFRTMVAGTAEYGPQVTASDDPRITPFGHFLRKTKLDELPQLLNVLQGTMSLVGPRPQVPRFVAHFPEAQRRVIFSVRPGLTDLATLRYRNEESLLAKSADPEQLYIRDILPDKLQLNVAYVRQQTMIGDFLILVRTIACLIHDRIARPAEPSASPQPISIWPPVEPAGMPAMAISDEPDSQDEVPSRKQSLTAA